MLLVNLANMEKKQQCANILLVYVTTDYEQGFEFKYISGAGRFHYFQPHFFPWRRGMFLKM